MTTALILHTQRFSTEDGPGIRTTVFFKGCSLRCAWCHNPESLTPHPQVQWLENRCIGCGTCLPACPNGALTRPNGAGLLIDRARCQGCGMCVEACPGAALELLGRRVAVTDLAQELARDRVYYDKSGGGVTASGGEPALQAGCVAELFRQLRVQGIRTALDTCGQCAPAALAEIVPHADLVLYDLKLVDAAAHARFTGQTNDRILANLLWLRDALHAPQAGSLRRPPALWIRTPLIPDATADAANVSAIGAFLARELPGAAARWELCAFNNLCRDKYRRLGMNWPYATTPLMRQAELDALGAAARASGVDPAIVAVTGAARVES